MTTESDDLLNGRYRIETRLAKGGMGAVYRAFDTLRDESCAVKEFSLGYLPSEDATRVRKDEDATRVRDGRRIPSVTREKAAKQFKLEARLLAKLDHPNLPKVIDYFAVEDNYYLVMELIEGQNLAEVLELGDYRPLLEKQVLGWMDQVMDALAYCHELGVIHRDVKPANVIITPSGKVYLVDFGVAKLDPDSKTMLGSFTSGYSPPEQYSGQGRTDERSDVYALGATMYRLLTGQEPVEAFERVIGKHMPPPRSIVSNISPTVDSAVMQAMELRPENRFASVVDMKRGFEGGVPSYPDRQEVVCKRTLSTMAARLRSFAAQAPRWAKALVIIALILLVMWLFLARLGLGTPETMGIALFTGAILQVILLLLTPLGLGIGALIHFGRMFVRVRKVSYGVALVTAVLLVALYIILGVMIIQQAQSSTLSLVFGLLALSMSPLALISFVYFGPRFLRGGSLRNGCMAAAGLYVGLPMLSGTLAVISIVTEIMPLTILALLPFIFLTIMFVRFAVGFLRGRNARYGYAAAAILIVIVGNSFFPISRQYMENFRVEGYAMEPNVSGGDYIIVWKGSYEPRRGDIVVFRSPQDPQRTNVSRVIGLPGETVEARRKEILINGKLLSEPYLVYPATYTWGPAKVGLSELIVLGDNRGHSEDSHNWGAVSLESTIGKAWLCYWPPEHWGFLGETIIPTPTRITTVVREKDNAIMVFVPGGPFIMGSTDAQIDDALTLCNEFYGDCKRTWFDDEDRQHTVTLGAFWIDAYEVTNSRYALCVQAGACNPPAGKDLLTRVSYYYGNPAYDSHPVVWVSWNDAKDYCMWAGARLPTEAEWEKAARGTRGQIYPWGDSRASGKRVNYCDVSCQSDWKDASEDDGYAETAPVGNYATGRSPYGAYDMAGNVWEWVADWYDSDYYSRSPSENPIGPASGDYKVARGGSWLDTDANAHAADRYSLILNTGYSNVGFRCVAGTVTTPIPIQTRIPQATRTPTTRPTTSITPSPTPTVTAQTIAVSALLTRSIFDDFSDKTSGWPEFSDADGEWAHYEKGEYHILTRQTGGWFTHVERPEVFSDFILEVEARQVEGPDNNAYGLMCRYKDDSSYYILISGDGSYLVAKQARGESALIKDWTALPAIRRGNSTNNLKVVAEGSHIALFINDKHVASFEDTSLAEGQIGLIAGAIKEPDVHIAFDNLKVEASKFDVAFEDDFSDKSGGWREVSQANHQTWYKNGEYHALVKKPKMMLPWPRQDIYTDCILEVAAGQVSGPDKNVYGLVFRHQDGDNYYALLVSSEGRYGLLKLVAGQWTFLEGDYIASPYIKKGNGANHLQVIAQGSQITVFINDQQVTSIRDTTFAEGQVGLAFGSFEEPNVHVRFDNFRVKLSALTLALEDYFDDEASGWGEESDDQVEGLYEDGEYHILIKQPNLNYPVTSRKAFSDFVLEVDARQAGGLDANAYGLDFRRQDSDNFYQFLISGEGSYKLRKRLEGEWINIKNWTASPHIKRGNASNHLKVVAQGVQIVAFINGEYITTIVDESFVEGTVGFTASALSAQGVHIHFDNFKVWSSP